jgi:hypothetical protein
MGRKILSRVGYMLPEAECIKTDIASCICFKPGIEYQEAISKIPTAAMMRMARRHPRTIDLIIPLIVKL